MIDSHQVRCWLPSLATGSPKQDPTDPCCCPGPTTGSRDAPRSECLGNLSQTTRPSGLGVLNRREQRMGTLEGLAVAGLRRRYGALRLIHCHSGPVAPIAPPSFTPRALAAARAALVRSDARPASSSATSAICDRTNLPMAPEGISGISQKQTSTSPSMRRRRNGHA